MNMIVAADKKNGIGETIDVFNGVEVYYNGSEYGNDHGFRLISSCFEKKRSERSLSWDEKLWRAFQADVCLKDAQTLY